MATHTPERYDPVAQALHWGMAVAMIALWVVGQSLEALPKGPMRTEVIGLHKAVGVLILVLAVVRLGWRAVRPAPALPATMTAREVLGAKLGHAALYALMVLMPIDGVLLSQSGGRAVSVFGLVLPTLVDKSEPMHEAFEAGHAVMGWVLAAVLAVHVAAALYHHYRLKDDVLRRMVPWSI
ncbi:MAG: cytochrome b [Actinomycetota bacterium]